MAYIYLVGAFVLNAGANILLKIGSRQGIQFDSYAPLPLIAHNWQFILGCFLFACNAVLYFFALRALPISIAYPIMVTASFIIINSYALLVLGEHILPVQIVGYAFILAGLFLVVRFAS